MLATRRVSNSYLPGLDGLRALAVTAVICSHANIVGNPFPEGWFASVLARVLGAGWVGVDLFFVLSGFLITRILIAAKIAAKIGAKAAAASECTGGRAAEGKPPGASHFFRNFYMRRALRIFPAYYLYAGLMLFVLPKLGGHLGSGEWRSGHGWDKASILLYFYNVRVAMTGHNLLLVNHLWSLAVEEHFYLVWPLMVWACRRRTLLGVSLLGLPAAFLCRLAVLHSHLPLLAAYQLTPCHLEGLLLGAFVALAQREESTWRRVRSCAPYALAAGALAVAGVAAWTGHFYGSIETGDVPGVRSSAAVLLYGISAVTIFCAGALVLVLEGGRVTRWLEQPLLRRVGRLSYGIYLYHLVILWIGYDVLRASPLWHAVPMPALKLCLAAGDLGVSLGLAALSYRFVEAPFLRLKRYFPEAGQAGLATGAASGPSA